MPHPTVLVDTNVIIECHKQRCWSAFAGAYPLETVAKCVEETQTGKQLRSPEQWIDETALRRSLQAVHDVTSEQIAEVLLLGGADIHEGERYLWAHARCRTDAWILCGPDSGSLRFGYNLGLGQRLISLEELFTSRRLSLPRTMERHYRRVWHQQTMTDLWLENSRPR